MISVAGTQDTGKGYEVVSRSVNGVCKRSRGRDQDGVTGMSDLSRESMAYCVNPLGGALGSARLLCGR